MRGKREVIFVAETARDPHGSHQGVDICIDCLGQLADFHFIIPDREMKLAEIVAPVRAMCDIMSEITLLQLRTNGLTPPCRMGCTACCRFLVPLSIPEALCLLEDIQSMHPDHREPILTAFTRAEEEILAASAPLVSLDRQNRPEEKSVEAIMDWWGKLKKDCPLLADEVCVSYATRPLACRSFYELFSEKNCIMGNPNSKIQLPISMVMALCRLTSRLEYEDEQAVVLQRAPQWAQKNAWRGQVSWPGLEIFRNLAEIVAELQTEANTTKLTTTRI